MPRKVRPPATAQQIERLESWAFHRVWCEPSQRQEGWVPFHAPYREVGAALLHGKYHGLLLACAFAGLGNHEVRPLEWDDFSAKDGTLAVFGRKPNTSERFRVRFARLSGPAADVFNAAYASRRGPGKVFPTGTEPERIRMVEKGLCASAGIAPLTYEQIVDGYSLLLKGLVNRVVLSPSRGVFGED